MSAGVRPDPSFWKGRKVFLTGHTGFKGGWLSLWLESMGAQVTGLALVPESDLALYYAADVAQGVRSVFGDIRDLRYVRQVMLESEAEVVFHLAAQPLVRASYTDPVTTYATNVMGTVNVLEAVRQAPTVRVVQVITTDKCYENREWMYPYRETDPLGGYDPYSNSKACAELVVDSYRCSFMQDAGIHLSSVRAGNVIGGGDWAVDRIVPDCIRSLLDGRPVQIRSPHAIRPWQHVLEPLCGYLCLAERQHAGQPGLDEAFNFGPDSSAIVPVCELAAGIVRQWGDGQLDIRPDPHPLHEAGILRLDVSKSAARLGWHPRWGVADTLFHTVDWYRRVGCLGDSARQVCLEQIAAYVSPVEISN
ncbi:MAG: CDP-glucose 4,6-dehydratase [Laribacter sp.]|nr:CDP-glucose 4,6-dehydratase [Laribacter sp.]